MRIKWMNALVLSVCGALVMIPAPEARAQRFTKELELLDTKTLKYDDAQLKEIIENLAVSVRSVLNRVDILILSAREIMRLSDSSFVASDARDLDDRCDELVREINILINVMPGMSNEKDEVGPDKKKTDRFQRLLFAARSEVLITQRDVDMRRGSIRIR